METKEFKIEVPKGYEIDRTNSTFEKIVFKPIKQNVNTWEDIAEVEGWFISTESAISCCNMEESVFDAIKDRNVYRNKKYAKSALALAQISQLLPYYDTQVDWETGTTKHVIRKFDGKIDITYSTHECYVLAFNTEEELERFLRHNKQLVKDYLMID